MSDYADLLERTTRTARVYKDVPLSTLSESARGKMLEKVARRYEETATGNDTISPLRLEATFDWQRQDGMRVESKSAQLCFSERHQLWKFGFHRVKLACFDRSLLTFYTPRGIYMGEWDGATGFSRSGKLHEKVRRLRRSRCTTRAC